VFAQLGGLRVRDACAELAHQRRLQHAAHLEDLAGLLDAGHRDEGAARLFEDDQMVVVLGDNIIQDDITPFVKRFEDQDSGARILLKRVPDPERFGVPELDGDRIIDIQEKPQVPKSDFAVTGIYMYDRRVFDFCRKLKPSDRGELEITDVNNAYIKAGDLHYDILDGWWTDAGQFESLYHAAQLVARERLGSGLPV